MEPIRLELPTVFGMKTVNAYLFLEPEPVLIDCGEQNDLVWNALQAKLAEYHLQFQDIKRIIITHAHVDHIGMAGRLATEFGIPIWVNEYTYPAATQPAEVFQQRQQIVFGFMDKFDSEKSTTFRQTYTKTIQFFNNNWQSIPKELVKTYPIDGTLSLGGLDWQVMYAPGHAVDQTCFYQADNQWLLSADMLLNIAPTPIPGFHPERPGKRVNALADLLASYQKFRALEIKKVYPGHYAIFENHIETIDKQVKRIYERMEECYDWIEKGVSNFFELLHKLYKGRIWPPSFFMLLGYLDMLESDGRVVQKEIDGTLGYYVNKVLC